MVDTMGSKPMRLMGAAELCERLGVSRQRTYKIAERPDFPKPVAKLGQGTVWLSDEVEAWMKIHRPPVDDSEA
jgi:predicted DNA-binding transcriptional regulator AlpA